MCYGGRFLTLGTELPVGWEPERTVKISMRILEKPDQTDTKTIITKGKWRIEIKEYRELVLGDKYSFVGRVETESWAGKTIKIEMVDPEVSKLERGKLRVSEWVILKVAEVRERMVGNLARWLPEPEASLAAGILLGVRRRMPWEFYQDLIKTGTVHIVAASGYNVTIVARVVMVPLLRILGRAWAIPAGIGAIVLYTIVAGGSAAVVRAAIMASLTLLAYYWGRATEARRLLWLTAGVMLFVNPLMIVDVGFQLSVAATAGLLYVEPWIRRLILRKKEKESWLQRYLAEYLTPTLAANITTLPIILLTFGRISWFSPIVNMFVLPLTPLIMFLSGVAVAGGMVSFPLGRMLALILYAPLWIMVRVIKGFG
ncbi:MAG: ComEC/Rec2 family competence protein [bacterium]